MENISYIEENIVSIFVPMIIKKRGSSAMIILPKNAPKEGNKQNHDAKLINAFAKAYKWQQSINNGKVDVSQLMEKEKIGMSYLSRILRLNFIAPDIVTAIVEGKQPRDLKLQDLMTKTIPDLWQEQREKFGFNQV